MHEWMHDTWGAGGSFMMWGFWVVVALLLALLVVWILRSGERGEPPRRADRSALDILEERYARGEIGDEEFEEKKRRLGE